MKKFAEFLSSFEQTFAYVLGVLLTVILFTQVINRYIFSTSFVWLEEIARISFVWLIYFCVASAARQNTHIRIGLIDAFEPASVVKVITIFADILVIGFSLFIVWLGFDLIGSTIEFNEKTPVTNIPMGIIYAVIPFCFALMAFRILGYNMKQVFKKSPKNDNTDGNSMDAFGD